MVDAIAFQARARTVDHLGREQIADCPTAISELWKNSFDAYARSVHLHVLDGDVCTAALVDDGHGMSKDELLSKWLVLGTESKASGTDVSESDRDGLPIRRRQGQKGIGRLSAAALGPLMLLVSKRESSLFVAALVDWRLFENPFLFLNDIKIPVVEFVSTSDLLPLVDQMFDRLMGNIWGDNDDLARKARIERAWGDFEKLELAESKPSTRAAIEEVLLKASITDRQMNHWAVWQGQRPHGTAMIVADVSFDLRALLPGLLESADESVAEVTRTRLKNTLENFTDPYAGELKQPEVTPLLDVPESMLHGVPVEFAYGVTAWRGALNTPVVSDVRDFGLANLVALEHVVDGWVDAAGVFRGRIKAFGKWLEEEILIKPEAPIKARNDSRVGPFGIRLANIRATTQEHYSRCWCPQSSNRSRGSVRRFFCVPRWSARHAIRARRQRFF